MARSGVTQEDVNAAADQLLQAGERPTIERVRTALGTGSPNTLIRLLDVWWADLGQRLHTQEAKLALPGAPAAVVAAASAMWEQALLAAQTTAGEALQDDRRSLLADRADLEAERLSLQEQADAHAAARIEARQAQGLAEARLVEAQRLAEHQAAQLRDLIQQRDASQHRADRLEQELLALGDRVQRQEAAAAVERETHTQYVRAIEDRAHAEVDRSRQELKGLRSQLTTVEREQAAFAARAREGSEEALAATTAAKRDAALAKARENSTPRKAKSQAASRGQPKSRKSA